MKILLTGASGFLGSILLQEFLSQGHSLKTLGRGNNDDLKCNLSSNAPILLSESFDMVVHCAGKAHSIPKTTLEKQEFFDVNVRGTRNLLEGLVSNLPKFFIFISTVAVYGLEEGTMINEESPRLATDPYGKSKIQAEQLVQDWCFKNNVICTILRLPLIAGPNPPGNLKSMINGIKKGYYFNIAHGKARKSIVLAKDVAHIIPIAAAIGGTYNLTDNYHPSFAELAKLIANQLNKSEPSNIPSWLATCIGKLGNLLGQKAPLNTKKLYKITSDLTFDDTKAFRLLHWKPSPVLKGFKIK